MKPVGTNETVRELEAVTHQSFWQRLKETQVSEIMSGLLVVLFAYTVITKLSDIEYFKYQLYNQVFSAQVSKALVYLLPLSEIIATALLCISKLRFYGLLVSILLMGAFTAYTIFIVAGAFDKVPCVCGGVISNMSWPVHLVFNCVFFIIAIIGLRFYLKERRPKKSEG
ncbi:MAG: hypothetical protein LBF27_30915 [Sphingobacterium sp.]|jgi:hypothetical protein|nr:hypothetical protein [Sphingobacterium sp.]